MNELKLALLQTNWVWHDPEQNRTAIAQRLAAIEDIDLVVLPEMFTTGFTMASRDLAESMQGPTIAWLSDQARQHKTAICGSLIISASGSYYNRFVLVLPDGHVETVYDKRHLFRMADEHNHFSEGVDRVVFTLNGVRICPQICYDLRFPVFARNRDDYDLLLVVANWPAARRHHWRTLLTARAIENQSYVVGLNRVGTDGNQVEYCGDSGLIHPNGEWLTDLKKSDQIAVCHIDLEALRTYRGQFPAWRDADKFSLVD